MKGLGKIAVRGGDDSYVDGDRLGISLKLSGGAMLTASVDAGRLRPGAAVTVGVRPDTVSILSGVAEQHEKVNHLPAVVRHTEHTGDATVLYADVDGAGDSFVARFPRTLSAERGARLILSVSPAAATSSILKAARCADAT